ncbi:polysaccharide lyase [Klebsiella pneumoniae]|nr:polysaccharide lyase [Klebsiella pneumoniae]
MGVGLSGLPWFYPRGEWQNITLKVKLNTVNFQNGIVKLWVNNKLVIDRRDVLFRKTPNLKIDGVLFSTFLVAIILVLRLRNSSILTSRILKYRIGSQSK